MQIIRPFLWGLILTLFSLQAFAWKVNLQSSEKSDDTPQVIVSNDREMAKVDLYLVWFDLDAKADKVFLSWRFQWGWQTGIKSVFDVPIDIPSFESYNIPFQDKICPQDHRCFLAFLATPDGKSPLNGQKNWQATSFLPLSLSASCERFPGQEFFLSCGDNAINRFTEVTDTTDTDVAMAPPSAEKEAVSDEGGAPETEKPDIFKLLDHQLLYANRQAKRFQVIDITDLSHPRLAGWTALAGSPRELYVLGDYYVLLQTNYVGKEGTHLTVLRQNDEGNLTTVQEMSLSGRFIESRRRGSFIYSVTEQFDSMMDCGEKDCIGSQQTINITVLRLSETGQLEEVDKAQLSGYSPTIAIFPDHLIIANHNEGKWRSTQVQAFDLSQVVDPLVTLPLLKVPGQIPSEFHLSVKNQQLRVVYGPEDRTDGSTLAIYDLTSPDMALVGEISKIAPGEDLFATRFVDNRAFVVTFERKDPLWVIDLTDPTNPSILGELHVPGWSEKMFFHEDRLFAVGIDDQPLENEEKRWVRRVALSLFDVKDPTKPTLINRFTPLAGEVTYSWSQALDDERALLLNWEDAFAALPIESHETEAGSHLQIVSLANDKIEDAGILESPIPIQRSLSLSENVLAALGDQALLTLRWGTGKPEVLGELELATNLTWLTLQKNDLWAAARGNKGFNRLYRFTTKEVETPAQRWTLPKGYNGLKMDGHLAVFYNHYPLTVQVLDVSTEKLSPPQSLEKTKEPSEGIVDVEPVDDVEKVDVGLEYIPNVWYDRSQPLVQDGWFYIAEQRPFKPSLEQVAFVPEQEYPQPQWILRSWNVKVEGAPEASTRSIPGRPLAFEQNGHLITQEMTEKGQLRLNLLALEVDNARLLHSRTLSCSGYSRVFSIDKAVYVNCEENRYQPGPITYSRPPEKIQEPTTQESQEPTTQLLKLKVNPGQGFMDEGSWHFSGYQNLRAVSDDVVLMASNHWYYRPWMDMDVAVKPAMMLPPDEESGCNIYQLRPKKEPVLLKKLETCPYSDEGLVLTGNQVWMAEGFAGIKTVNW